MIFKKLIKFLTIMSIGFVTSLNVAAARDWDTELEKATANELLSILELAVAKAPSDDVPCNYLTLTGGLRDNDNKLLEFVANIEVVDEVEILVIDSEVSEKLALEGAAKACLEDTIEILNQ